MTNCKEEISNVVVVLTIITKRKKNETKCSVQVKRVCKDYS